MRIIVLFLLFLISCRGTQPISVTTPTSNRASAPEEHFIAFVNLKISKDSLQQNSTIILVSNNKVSGKLKEDKLSHHAHGSNWLILEIYKNKQLINTISMEHPLFKHVEYWDDTKFVTKFIKLQSEEFFVRLPVRGKDNQLSISEILEGKPKTILTTITL